MSSYNKVILLGNLTRDPTLTYTPSQTAVVDFGIASNRTWNDQSGQKREEVCFVDCKCFGKTAENINKFFKKGKSILVEGRLSLDQWQDQQGNKRSKHKITVDSFQFIGDNGGGKKEEEQQPEPWTPSGPERNGPQSPDSDLPF